MKLFYHKEPSGNFGDDINPWLWYGLIPEVFDGDDTVLMLGCGTLINHKLPTGIKKLVFGAGVGYGALPALDSDWEIVFVRGKLSAQKLGLHLSAAITDPAILVARMVSGRVEKIPGKVAFMPHHDSQKIFDWRPICEEAGIVYLDPAEDIHRNIHEIRQSELVLAEAMHAAIVADTLRIPWRPVKCYQHVLDFKWQDWCSSLDLAYAPLALPPLRDLRLDGILQQARGLLNRARGRAVEERVDVVVHKDRAVALFDKAKTASGYCLSKANTWSDKLSQVEDKLMDLKSNYLDKR